MQAFHDARLHFRFPHKLGLAMVLVVAADILLYGHAPGISAALFAVLLATGVWQANRPRFGDPAVRAALMLTAAGILALVENVSWLSAAFAIAGLVTLAMPGRADWRHDGAGWLAMLFAFATRAWLTALKDTRLYRVAARRTRRTLVRKARLVAWVLPVGASMVFLALFADANPIIFDWLAALFDFELPPFDRILFWLAAALLCWPFIRPRLPRFHGQPTTAETQIGPAIASLVDLLFSRDAVLRSLVIFNGIFAVQTALDASYLWGGLALPHGMTYAQYAHRGAYPLVAAALLAAGFVLIAMRPGGAGAQDRLVRLLVYGWVAQTVILVAGSIWRTWLYVSVYSLTYLRVAAVIWMVLVAAGLIWILLRMALGTSNGWLIRVNLLTAMAILYAVCFVDVGDVIARFNVEHSRLATGWQYDLDLDYLEEIGPAALPALDWYLAAAKARWSRSAEQFDNELKPARMLRNRLAWRLAQRRRDWRAYGFRSYRLALYIENKGIAPYHPTRPDGRWSVR